MDFLMAARALSLSRGSVSKPVRYSTLPPAYTRRTERRRFLLDSSFAVVGVLPQTKNRAKKKAVVVALIIIFIYVRFVSRDNVR